MVGSLTEAQFSSEDRELLARAAACDQCAALGDCWQPAFAELAQTRGLEFATALLYDRVLRHPKHAEFFQRVHTGLIADVEKSPLVGIVPGAFYQNHKHTGADGARLVAILKSLGVAAEVVPVESFGSLKRNAMLLEQWLLQHREQRVVLISLSKGSADVKTALALPGASELFGNVAAWISLSGLPQGTPLVAWLRKRRLRSLGVRLVLALRGQRYSVVEELRHESDGSLAAWPKLPSHLRIIHVVGFPLRRHLTHRWAGKGYERLSPLGPNDGGGFLLNDVARLPGIVFPVWGADHYLQPAWDSTPLLRRVLAEAIATNVEPLHANDAVIAPIIPPASRSTA